MSDVNSLLQSVERLLEKSDRFSRMEKGQKANFRANLTSALKEANKLDDPELVGILESLQEEIGPSESPIAKKLTIEDLEKEYTEEYLGKNMRQRGAYKAKLQGFIKRTAENGESELAERGVQLQNLMAETELTLRRKRVLALAKRYNK